MVRACEGLGEVKRVKACRGAPSLDMEGPFTDDKSAPMTEMNLGRMVMTHEEDFLIPLDPARASAPVSKFQSRLKKRRERKIYQGIKEARRVEDKERNNAEVCIWLPR